MTKDDADKTIGTNLSQKGLGLLDRAWTSQWALRLVCLVLFLDMALMLRVGRGLWQWSAGDRALLSDVGWLALVVVAFSLTVAIVIPVVLILLRQLGTPIVYWLSSLTFAIGATERPYQRSLGYVPTRALRDLALCEKDAFLIRLYEEHVQAREAERASREQAGELTAAAILTVLLDCLIAQPTGGTGLIGATYGALGNWAHFVTVAVLLCAGLIMKWAWFTHTEPDCIYYPPLDRVLRDKERLSTVGESSISSRASE